MTTYNFREVRRTVDRTLSCGSCGKAVKRTFTGTATYNPFNDGNPPEQALEHAKAEAERAEQKGVTCKWCDDAPYREALLALADTGSIPDTLARAEDILVERGNITRVYDESPCPCCKRPRWDVTGHKITDKGHRVIAKARAAITAATGGEA